MIDMILAAWERAYKRSVLASKKVDDPEPYEIYVLSRDAVHYAMLGGSLKLLPGDMILGML